MLISLRISTSRAILYFSYIIFLSLPLIYTISLIHQDICHYQGKLYTIEEFIPIFNYDYLSLSNFSAKTAQTCMIYYNFNLEKYTCYPDLKRRDFINITLSNNEINNLKPVGIEVLILKSGRRVFLSCLTRNLSRYERSPKVLLKSVKTFEQTNKPLVRPAIAINPVGYVPLTSSVLFPIGNSTINPLHITSYLFRIVDINIGMIQCARTSKDEQESWSRVEEFTGKDVLSKNIRYVANIMQPENLQTKLRDTIRIQVIHPTNTDEQAILEIPVNFSRIELRLTRNEPLTVFQMSKTATVTLSYENCITRWNLNAQSIPTDCDMNVCFTITEMPKHGHIYLHKGNNDKVYLGVGSIFRQSDVNEGELFYKFRRVIDDWSSATSRIENGLIYIQDEFKFRIHVHSYRPRTEHIFNIDILESTTESSFSLPMSVLPLKFRKQIGVIQKGGVLIIQPSLVEIKKSICLRLPNVNFKSSPTFEYIIEVLSNPKSGKIRILNPDETCSIDTKYIPMSLVSKGMLAYVHDGSYYLNDEFDFQIICHDTRGLFKDVLDDQIKGRLLILKQMIKGMPPIGNPFIETFHVRIQPDKYLEPQMDFQIYDGKLLVKTRKNYVRTHHRFYLSCPRTDSSDEYTGGYFTEQGKGTTLSTIAISDAPQPIFKLIPLKTDTFSMRCYVSDGLYSFHKEIQNQYFKMVVDLQKELDISTTVNGTAFIFFKMVHSVDINPEDVTVRVIGQPTSGCILLDNQITDKFDYSAVLRYRVVYWQYKPLKDQTFGISDLDEIQAATVMNYILTVENFDALTLEVTSSESQGSKWSGRVDVKVKLIINDLTLVNDLKLHPTIDTPLLRIDSNPLSAIFVDPNPPKFINVRISRNPSQLRDILSHQFIDISQETFFKVLKVPCQIKLVMFISRLSVENVVTFSSSDLLEGRVYVIPSANCNNETADSELHLLQQITNTRGYTYQQPFTIRINVSPRSHYISFRNLTIGVGETISLKTSNLHISEMDEEGKLSSILDCRCFSLENNTYWSQKSTPINEIFVVEEQPTCGRLISKRLNRTIRMFSKKNLLENDIYFEHNGKETCNFASITISGIIRGEVETRVPRQRMTFFLLVRGVPVYLIRLETAQIWWSSVTEISPSNLAAQVTAAYEDSEVNDYAHIEYKIRGLKGGLISSSSSELVPVSIFSNEDIQQHRVVFQHDGKSSSAGFKFSLIYGNYESAVHEFNIDVQAVKNLSLRINPIIGQVDSFSEVSMTNISPLLILTDDKNYDLTRICKTDGLKVSYKVMDTQSPCYFEVKSATNIYSSTTQASTFTQCDIYSGHVLISCTKAAQSKTAVHLKAQVIDSVSSNLQRIIYTSEMLKLDVIIHERFAGISREVSIINLDDPESFRLEDIRMYDVGYNFYQPALSSLYVVKSLPIYGDILCDGKVVKIGDAICKSPIYKHVGGPGILDKFSLEVFSNSGKDTQSTTVTIPMIIRRSDTLNVSKRPLNKTIQITMTDTHLYLKSVLLSHINSSMCVITNFPIYGDVYFKGLKIKSFNSALLKRNEIYYQRDEKYLSDFTQENIRLVVCEDWPDCQVNTRVIEIQLDELPVEKKILYQNIYYDSQNRSIPIHIDQRPPSNETFLIKLKPNIGQVLYDNFEVVKISPSDISTNRISYYRSEWNTSNDEFVLEQSRSLLTMVFRVVSRPLIRFKTFHVPYGKEFVLNSRLFDYSSLQESIERLRKRGFVDINSNLKQALMFSVPRNTSIGKFFKTLNDRNETEILEFTYKELSNEIVKFKNYDNITVQTTTDGIRIKVSAPMFMAAQMIPIKISIMSTQYNVQDNILLSDFVDEMGSIDSQTGTTIYDVKQQKSGNLKIWFAIAIGVVCFIVCIFVTAAYFYLRRWRSQRRIQARCTAEPLVYVDSYRPKPTQVSRMIERTEKALPSPIMVVPLTVITSQNTNTGTVSADQFEHWERRDSRQEIPTTTFYVIHGDSMINSEQTGSQTIPCIVSQTPITTIPLTKSQQI